MFILGSLENA